MVKMPFKVSKYRFKPSPVWNPESGEKEVVDLKPQEDPYGVAQSYKEAKKKIEEKVIKDVEEW